MINLHVLSFVKRTGTIEGPGVFGVGAGNLKTGWKVQDGTHGRSTLLAFPTGLTPAQPGIV